MPNACVLCYCVCGIEVKVEGRRLAKIRGDKADPSSKGYACQKAQRLDLYQSNPHRLTSPLRRREDGTYEKISWEVAISEIADRLMAIRDEHGGDRIFYFGGGGQGNHLAGLYGRALQAAVGSQYYSNSLAQEKSGEMWVDGRLYGGHTAGDFEAAEVAMFIGKNPWQTHNFPRARPVLKEMAADPNRAMIVIDPRRSETAAMADIHLQVRPGTDAWCLAALCAVMVQENLIDHEFVERHTSGSAALRSALGNVSIASYSERCGVPEPQIRQAARRFASADSACVFEDLGIQQAPNSTLSSYLNKLLWILTGNFAKQGGMFLHSWFVPVIGSGNYGATRRMPRSNAGRVAKVKARVGAALSRRLSWPTGVVPNRLAVSASIRIARALKVLPDRIALLAAKPVAMAAQTRSRAAMIANAGGSDMLRTPVTGARIVDGLVPCNSISDEILTDHPNRFRAIWIESTNPAHSIADSKQFRKAMKALELSVVVDVAMSETARLADYVLPAASQFEKHECSFFSLEFPRNTFHLRQPLMDPLPGTLAESEIYVRLIRQLGVVDDALLNSLRSAAKRGRVQFALAFFGAIGADPKLERLTPYLLYETLGSTLMESEKAVAALWAVAQLCSMSYPAATARAGFSGSGFESGERLFDAILKGRRIVFTEDDYADAWDYCSHTDERFTIEIPEMLKLLDDLDKQPTDRTSDEFPFVLMAGERRSYTANTIVRDPAWRKSDPDGALRIAPGDADRLGVATGGRVRVMTEAGSAEVAIDVTGIMQPGHISLPNGLGLDFVDDGGELRTTGVGPNELTSLHHKDEFAGTPFHKYVPARIELVSDGGEMKM